MFLEMSDRISRSSSPRDERLKIKKSRASRPKVKTGCQTCKIRRVKCDETKPFCLRCTKFGHSCDGYAPSALLKPGQIGQPSRALVPKIPIERLISHNILSAPVRLAPIRLVANESTQSVFHDEEEYHCFQRFCAQTSRQLSSLLTKDLWAQIMLQACETSPPIRHAIISLGRLNRAPNTTTAIATAKTEETGEVGTLRHQFSYRKYSKSAYLMHRGVGRRSKDLRTTLNGCLLFYCFESFQGYQELVASQIYSGLRMIRDWATSLYKPDAHGNIRCKIGTENPYIVEDDILRAFGNLEIQVMGYADGKDADLHFHYRQSGQRNIDEMTKEFRELEKAKLMLELVIRRSMHWLRSTMHLQNVSSSGIEMQGLEMHRLEQPITLLFDIDPTLEEQVATVGEFERWDKAFQPLLKIKRHESADDLLEASTLRLHWLASYLVVASNNCNSLVSSGKFISELAELVEIVRLLQESADEEYTFDMQILLPLMMVGWVYKHRALRRQAVQNLLRSPKKENAWDGNVVGKVMTWLMRVEEELLVEREKEEEYVPERAALKCVEISFDSEKREAYASCLQPVEGRLAGKDRRREVVIPW